MDRFAAALCFLLASASLATMLFGVLDFTRNCAAFRHGCFYLAFAAPVFLAITLVAAAAGFWLWPRKRSAPTTNRPPSDR